MATEIKAYDMGRFQRLRRDIIAEIKFAFPTPELTEQQADS